MNAPAINYLGVLLAVVASMIVGFVFYHPKVAGSRWMRAVGHDEASMGNASPLTYPIVIVCSFVTAWVLAGATWLSHGFYGGSYLLNALISALVLWVGFTATRFVVHDAFEPRRFAATGWNVLNELLTVCAMALAIGLLPPG